MMETPANRVRSVVLSLLLLGAIGASGCQLTVVERDDTTPIEERTALLILPGFGYSGAGRDALVAYFSGRGHDLLIPDHAAHAGLDATIENLRRFLDEVEIDRYREVHVFAFILGTWTLHWILEDREMPNLRSLVHDASPLQERAPRVVKDALPGVAWWFAGWAIPELAEREYPPLRRRVDRFGAIVESRASDLIRDYRDETLALGPVSFAREDLREVYNDVLYTPLNHDEMYLRPELYGAELLRFIREGRFCDSARREPLGIDPFETTLDELLEIERPRRE